MKNLEKALFYLGWISFLLIVAFMVKASFWTLEHSKIEAVVATCSLIVSGVVMLIHQIIWQNQKNPRIKRKK